MREEGEAGGELELLALREKSGLMVKGKVLSEIMEGEEDQGVKRVTCTEREEFFS